MSQLPQEISNEELQEALRDPEAFTGDGKAVFIMPMTEAQFEEHEHLETHGWRGFMNRLMGNNTAV